MRACQVSGVDADDLPVERHGCLVAVPLDLGALQGVGAEVEQGGFEGVARVGWQCGESGSPGGLEVAIGVADYGGIRGVGGKGGVVFDCMANGNQGV